MLQVLEENSLEFIHGIRFQCAIREKVQLQLTLFQLGPCLFFPAAVFVVTLRQCTLLHVVLVTEEL